MKRYEIKTTLCRSNPQVIRQFEIDGDNSVERLLQVTALVHGWDKSTKLQMVCACVLSDPEQTLDSVFSGKAGLERGHILRPMAETQAGQMSFFEASGENNWDFRLDILRVYEANEGAAPPLLLRYRGVHPSLSAASIQQCNRRMLNQAGSSSAFYYGWDSYNGDDYSVKPVTINQKLRNLDKQIEEFVVDLSSGLPLHSILQSFTVDEIKSMLRDNHLNISYQGKKAAMIDRITDEFDTPEFWDNVLEQMLPEEYDSFKQFCSKGYQDIQKKVFSFPTLRKYNLCTFYGIKVLVAAELLEYYAQMMETEGDAQLLREKKFSAAMTVALRLYCIFPKEILKKLFGILYPERKDFEEIWKEQKNQKYKLNQAWLLTNYDVIYNRNQMDGSIAAEMSLNRKDAEFYYIPDKEEAETILNQGLGFAPREKNMLVQSLEGAVQNKHWVNHATIERIVQEAYVQIHLGYETSEIIKTIKQYYSFYFIEAKLEDFRKNLEKCSDKVRLVSEYGYTFAEIKAKMIQAAANKNTAADNKTVTRGTRIYPNDLCPCGSGKKYKHCHGKYKK